MSYNLRDGSKLAISKTKSSRFGINFLQFRGSLLWNNLPVSLKNCQSLNEFKLELKNVGNIYCTYLVCRLSIFLRLFSNFIDLIIYDIYL